MGRNGAGKSTLLRHAAGLMRPTRGKRAQLPAGSRCCCRTRPTTWSTTGSSRRPRRPRCATVGLGDRCARRAPSARPVGRGEAAPGARDRARRAGSTTPPSCASTSRPAGWTAGARTSSRRYCATLDAAVLVATHDPEFVAAFAQRVVLLGDGAVIADGSPREVLAGGTTSPPRPRGSSAAPAARCAPDDGDRGHCPDRWRPSRRPAAMTWQLGAFGILGAGARRRLRLV